MRAYLWVLPLLFASAFAHADNDKTSTNKEIQVTGAEQWQINATTYHIDGSMMVRIKPHPDFLYVVRVFLERNPGKQDKTMARSIAKYALQKGYYARASAMKVDGHLPRLVPKIGVALVHKTHGFFSSAFHGYKFLFRLSALR